MQDDILPGATGPLRGAAVRPALPGVAPADEAARELRSLRDLLRWAVARMRQAGVAFGQGTDEAHDEAVWLLLWSAGLPPQRLEPYLDARLAPSEVRAAVHLVERRCTERVPAAWLVGEAWLQGLRFLSDPRALVPRSLVGDLLLGESADALEAFLPAEPATVLDLCTGGGSIAVMAALRFPDAAVTGADLSADALALAAENVALHGLADRIDLVHGDLFAAVAGRRFDLILSNPPYVNATAMAALPPEFRQEPPGALAGGDADGMGIPRRILSQATDCLTDDGLLCIEIGHEAEHFETAFADLEFAWLPVPAGDRMVAAVTRSQLLAWSPPA